MAIHNWSKDNAILVTGPARIIAPLVFAAAGAVVGAVIGAVATYLLDRKKAQEGQRDEKSG